MFVGVEEVKGLRERDDLRDGRGLGVGLIDFGILFQGLKVRAINAVVSWNEIASDRFIPASLLQGVLPILVAHKLSHILPRTQSGKNM